jgi:hypothetical protein
VRGALTGQVPPTFGWAWNVSRADGSPVAVTTVGPDPSLVEFPVATVGTYTIAVQLTGATCGGLLTITAANPTGLTATFRFHVTPPATVRAPAQDLERQVVGGTPSGGNVLALDPGIPVALAVQRADTGAALPAYVRLTNAVSGDVLEARTSANAPNALLVAQGTYGMLVVPDGDVAPAVFAPRAPAAIGGAAVALDDGTMVTGTVADGGGAPLAGATVVLRAGALVSTTATTDATGAFALRARDGTFGLTVVSSLAQGALASSLAADPGIVVAAATPPGPLTIKIQPPPLVAATFALSAQAATSLTPATRVTFDADGPLLDVAMVSVGGGPARSMTGDVRFTLHPQADGSVTTGGVPPGPYSMTVFPADASTTDGVTTMTLSLPTASAAPVSLALAQKVMLEGKLLPATTAAGVQIMAVDTSGLPIVSQGDASAGGLFALAVSPLRTYALRAVPRPDQPLARASFPVVQVMAGPGPFLVPDRSMPPALLYAGRVVDPNLQGAGTALVEVFCETGAAGCVDPATPVAETVTRSDGTFQVMLPDPGGTP